MNFKNISTFLWIYLAFILIAHARTSTGAGGGGTNPASQDPSDCCKCPNKPNSPCSHECCNVHH